SLPLFPPPSRPLSCSSHQSGDPPHLHPFPTRRSSDLPRPSRTAPAPAPAPTAAQNPSRPPRSVFMECDLGFVVCVQSYGAGSTRSEEHTSELQSRENLVCRLLLEKKKKNTTVNILSTN